MPIGNFKNRSVDASRFSMVPRADVPRSSFRLASSHKTTFDGGALVPIYVDEVLPGDSHRVRMTAFCRLGTLLYPLMDNLHLETFFFFVPNRLLWDNWVRLMGERPNPTDSVSFSVPSVVSPSGGFQQLSIADYMGCPTIGQVDVGSTVTVSALPFRAYALIFNEWFRDQNLDSAQSWSSGDGPDANAFADSAPFFRRKRPDYFTTCLPWPSKPLVPGTNFDTLEARYFGGQVYNAPIVFQQVGAPVTGIAAANLNTGGTAGAGYETGYMSTNTFDKYKLFGSEAADHQMFARLNDLGNLDIRVTINAIREAFQVARLQERDARGGTRYAELIRSHFGVVSPDARLQRPEYLGGGSSPIHVNPVAQQSGTGAAGTTTPLGHLSAVANGVVQGHGFSQSFTEHGWIIGIANVRADISYQQGLHRMWWRRTRYDFYWPAFANLSEQAVLTKELYVTGTATDDIVFGYQERWAEYRTKPALITGRFRSTTPGTLDAWHLAQRFVANPGLSTTFVEDRATRDGLTRVLAAGGAAAGQQILFDGFFEINRVRAVPTFSVPGMVDHF